MHRTTSSVRYTDTHNTVTIDFSILTVLANTHLKAACNSTDMDNKAREQSIVRYAFKRGFKSLTRKNKEFKIDM